MITETNVLMVKEVAKNFLYEPYSKEHMFFKNEEVTSTIFKDEETHKMIVLNVNKREDLKKLYREYRNSIEAQKDATGIMCLIRPEYYLKFFARTSEWLDRNDFSTLLGHAWTLCQTDMKNNGVSKEQMRKFFMNADRELLMNDKEKAFLKVLPEEINKEGYKVTFLADKPVSKRNVLALFINGDETELVIG